MKFLANEPMMQFLMHPLHRNDLAGMTSLYMELYTGPALTAAEIAQAQSASVNLSTSYINGQAMSNFLRTTRTRLMYGPSSGGYPTFTQKSHYGKADSKGLLTSQRSELLTFEAAGTATLAFVIFYNGSAWATGSRVGFLLSVGAIGSGAEVEMENPVIVNGGRYKLNDIIIKIAGLLGE